MKHFIILSVLMMTFVTTQAMAKDMTKEDIEAIIKSYIQNNPEVILDSVENYGKKQQEADMMQQQQAVKEHLGWLENNDLLPSAGNPQGDITVVEFFDYNCGYCKKALDDVMTLIDEDKNIKFVFVDMPILGQTSELAAKWSLAAKEQKAYLQYHIALMKNRGVISEEVLTQIGKDIGLDVEKLKTDADSAKIAERIAEKSEKAAKMGIGGTPAFIIDGQLYGGYIGLDKMREAVADARKSRQDKETQQDAKPL